METVANKHTESLTNVKKQVCFHGYTFYLNITLSSDLNHFLFSSFRQKSEAMRKKRYEELIPKMLI